jgi:hypothetical protein
MKEMQIIFLIGALFLGGISIDIAIRKELSLAATLLRLLS